MNCLFRGPSFTFVLHIGFVQHLQISHQSTDYKSSDIWLHLYQKISGYIFSVSPKIYLNNSCFCTLDLNAMECTDSIVLSSAKEGIVRKINHYGFDFNICKRNSLWTSYPHGTSFEQSFQ